MIGATDITTTDPAGTLAAVGDGSTDDCAAIQSHISAMLARPLHGGMLNVPGQSFCVGGSGLNFDGGVIASGVGRRSSYIVRPTDGPLITFLAASQGAGLRDLFISSYQGANPTTNPVSIQQDAYVDLLRCHIWGGVAGLYDLGTDGVREDCFIAGQVYNCISAGANWWRRCKFDQAFASTQHAFVQSPAAGTGVIESSFSDCDFSGPFASSFICQDPKALLKFTTCVFSSPVLIQQARWVSFSQCEFAANIQSSGGQVAISNCYALAPISAAGAINGGGNVNISF